MLFCKKGVTLPLLLWLCTALTVLAQDISGSISGTVKDSSGNLVPEATVTFTNIEQHAVIRRLITDDQGYYTARSLPIGNYSLKVEAKGFKATEIQNTTLHVNDALMINATLTVGSASETVTVEATSMQLNLENGTSSSLIDGVQVRELMLNNRNYEQLLQLQPGVAYGGANDQLYVGASLPSGTSNQVAFSVNGQRATANNWTLDGADNVDRGANLTLLTYPSVEAIAEFKSLRGTYTAQFGRSASSQVNVVTRSGTNTFHGNAYEFWRNDYLNANNYFNKLTTPFTPRPKLRYNDFGYTFGGPIWIPKVYDGRDKTFFFFSQEIRRVINYVSTSVLVPTEAERNGDFTNSYLPTSSGGGTGPAAVCISANPSSGACLTYGTKVATLSPTAKAYLSDIYSHVPTPPSAQNVAVGLDPHTLTYNSRNIFNNEQEILRIDQNLGAKLLIFYRYIHDSLPSQEAGGLYVGGGLPGVQSTSTRAPGTLQTGHVTWTASPTLIVDGGYAYSYGAVEMDPIGYASSAKSPDIKPTLPYPAALGIIPSISFSGYAAGISNAGTYRDYNHNHNAFGSVAKTINHHTITVGATFSHYIKEENSLGNGSPYPQGIFTFNVSTPTAAQASAVGGKVPSSFDSTFANFLSGVANGGYTQASFVLVPKITRNEFEAYVQDDWKIKPRLTLNLGVRYSFFPQPYDQNNYLTNFDPSKYVAANARTVDSTGYLCLTGATCANSNGANSGVPNSSGDSLNGMILANPGSNGHASPYGNKVASFQKANFAPRTGFAYDVFGNGKTALRGGYGIAFDSSSVSIYEQNEFQNPPYVNIPNYTSASFDNPAAGNPAVNLTVPYLVSSPVEFKTPYTQQFSLDLQSLLMPTWIVDIGYFGNTGTHLMGKIDINEIRPGTYAEKLSTLAPLTSSTKERPLNQIRPYRGYNAINAVETIFTSNYHGAQLKVQKRFASGSLLDFNYTWSKSLTTNPTDYSSAVQNTYNIAGEYGRAQYDRRHIFTSDFVWVMPWFKEQHGLRGRFLGGWEASGIVAINSGLPLTVTMSGGGTLPDGTVANDAAGLGILGNSAAGLRPDVIANPNVGQGLHKRLSWFNTKAFTAPPATSFRVGNEKRGVVNGPGFSRIDLGIFRNFKIKEDMDFQFRAEAFNVLNHTNWQAVGTTSTTASTFGQVTSTRDPRLLQLAGKFRF